MLIFHKMNKVFTNFEKFIEKLEKDPSVNSDNNEVKINTNQNLNEKDPNKNPQYQTQINFPKEKIQEENKVEKPKGFPTFNQNGSQAIRSQSNGLEEEKTGKSLSPLKRKLESGSDSIPKKLSLDKSPSPNPFFSNTFSANSNSNSNPESNPNSSQNSNFTFEAKSTGNINKDSIINSNSDPNLLTPKDPGLKNNNRSLSLSPKKKAQEPFKGVADIESSQTSRAIRKLNQFQIDKAFSRKPRSLEMNPFPNAQHEDIFATRFFYICFFFEKKKKNFSCYLMKEKIKK